MIAAAAAAIVINPFEKGCRKTAFLSEDSLFQYIDRPFIFFETVRNDLILSFIGNDGRIRSKLYETDLVFDRLHPGSLDFAKILRISAVFLDHL